MRRNRPDSRPADGLRPGTGIPTTENTLASPSPTDKHTDKPTTEPSRSPSDRPTEPGTKVIAAASDFGTILFDTTGQAIYLFDVEATTEPRCYQACADA